MIVDLIVYAAARITAWVVSLFDLVRLPADMVLGSYDWPDAFVGIGTSAAPWMVFVPMDWLVTFVVWQFFPAWLGITFAGFIYRIVMLAITTAKP